VNLRSFATVGLIALSVALLGGCAGTPPRAPEWDIGDRPQILIPGALRSDVKGLAMGSARSKGWTIVRSKDDQLVMQRPLDPASPAALAVGAASSTIPPVVEVTSAFVEQSGGVVVALGAELVMQPPGEPAPIRVDYTENYRDALTQSLESLRANWTANRQRLADAIPPETSHTEAEIASAAAGANSSNPLVQVWAQTLEEETASKRTQGTGTNTVAPTPATPSQTTWTQPAPEPEPEPRVAATPAPPPSAPAVPASRSTRAPAPVVEGTSRVSSRPVPAPTPQPAILPPVPVESVPPGDNMMTLNQAGGTGTWAYYAEQYARLRGCNLTDQGSVLIETRSDGEIHKVPCVGADSYLLKCQNGVCRGLQ